MLYLYHAFKMPKKDRYLKEKKRKIFKAAKVKATVHWQIVFKGQLNFILFTHTCCLLNLAVLNFVHM